MCIVNRNVCQTWKLKNAKGMLPKDLSFFNFI